MANKKAPVPTISITGIRGKGVWVTGATPAQVKQAFRALEKAAPLQNGKKELRRKQELLWSLVTRLVRKGKIRHHAKKRSVPKTKQQ